MSKKNIGWIIVLIGIVVAVIWLTACGNSSGNVQSFKVELVVDTEGVYSVFYSGYIDGERVCSGAAADVDKEELELGRVLEYEITSELLGENADLSKFSMDFSPFDDENQYELGRTNEVAFPAEYGMTYRIHLTQDESGFYAIPEWDDDGEESREKFTVEIGGDVIPDEEDWSYIQADYYISGEQYGFMYSCADEGEDVIKLDFYKDDLASFSDSPDFAPDITDFRIDLYLSYSDYKGDEAVEQAMYGNTGENVFLGSINISAEYGKVYEYSLTGNQEIGYTLE